MIILDVSEDRNGLKVANTRFFILFNNRPNILESYNFTYYLTNYKNKNKSHLLLDTYIYHVLKKAIENK